MYTAILMVALSTVGGHKCHGCYSSCDSYASCDGAVVVDCGGAYSACSCHKVKKHKCGLFAKLFHKKCKCSCAASCDGGCSVACDGGCSAPVDYCDPCGCSAPVEYGCSAPAMEATPTAPAPMPEPAAPPAPMGFKVNRSPLVAVSFEKADFRDEPIVLFARN